jgi:hypothetical protein
MQIDQKREIRFSDETMATVQKIMKRYPEGRQKSALRKQNSMVG